MDPETLRALKGLSGATARDATALRRLSEHLMDVLPSVLDLFYAFFQQQPLPQQYITTPDQWQRHRDGIRTWIVTAVTQADEELENLSARIGRVHANLELPSSVIITAASSLRELLSTALARSPRWNTALAASLARRWAYGVSLMVEASEEAFREAVNEQRAISEHAFAEVADLTRQADEAAAMTRLLLQIVDDVAKDDLLQAIQTVHARGSLLQPEIAIRLIRRLEGEAHPRLTERETEVLGLLASGARNQEVADQLVLSVRTVRFHIENLYQKLGVETRTQAVRVATERGLLGS